MAAPGLACCGQFDEKVVDRLQDSFKAKLLVQILAVHP